jgi:hypothetical protein
MCVFLTKLLLVVRSRLKSRARLEIVVLRRPVIVLSRKSQSRVRLRNFDRAIFVSIYRLFPSILDANLCIGRFSISIRDQPLVVQIAASHLSVSI